MLLVSGMVQSFTAENPSSMISSRRSDQLDKSQLDQLTPGPERFIYEQGKRGYPG